VPAAGAKKPAVEVNPAALSDPDVDCEAVVVSRKSDPWASAMVLFGKDPPIVRAVALVVVRPVGDPVPVPPPVTESGVVGFSAAAFSVPLIVAPVPVMAEKFDVPPS
jgi:hypothetical protein